MKNKGLVFSNTVLIVAILVGTFGSCKHTEKEPITELHGRVEMINSNTPVPNALVRFLTEEPSGSIWNPSSYTEVGSDTTDANGNFIIPRGTNAELLRAYGPLQWYGNESMDVYIDNCWDNGCSPVLELIPKAWVRIGIQDVEPLNPEIIGLWLYADGAIGEPVAFIEDIEVYVSAASGNLPLTVGYQFAYEDWSSSEYFFDDTPPPSPLDTTDYIIEY
jgi:hypothetical protein